MKETDFQLQNKQRGRRRCAVGAMFSFPLFCLFLRTPLFSQLPNRIAKRRLLVKNWECIKSNDTFVTVIVKYKKWKVTGVLQLRTVLVNLLKCKCKLPVRKKSWLIFFRRKIIMLPTKHGATSLAQAGRERRDRISCSSPPSRKQVSPKHTNPYTWKSSGMLWINPRAPGLDEGKCLRAPLPVSDFLPSVRHGGPLRRKLAMRRHRHNECDSVNLSLLMFLIVFVAV